MAARSLALLLPAVALAGCATTVQPVAIPLSKDPPQIELCGPLTAPVKGAAVTIYANVAPRDRLQYLVCALHAKAGANLAQASRWQNRTEWRDIPLLGAAATVAGLLLFGERDANNALKKGEQETISGIGFGAAAFAAFANYLSPEKARDLLRQGARGHFCLATQGELILSVYDSVDRTDQRDELERLAAKLSADLENPSQFGMPDAARKIRDAALTAVATYDTQVVQLDTAGVALGETTWHFGIDLMTRSDRGAQQVDALVKAITEQTASVTKFSQTEAKAADPVPSAELRTFLNKRVMGAAAGPATKDAEALAVATKTVLLLTGLVNVEALVLGFDKCAATALAGGAPKADRIQRVTLR